MNQEEIQKNNKRKSFDLDGVAATATTEAAVVSKDSEEKESRGSPLQHAAAAAATAVKFQSRTIRPDSINSQRRAELLPAYPLASDNHRVLLLLSNVPHVDREKCEQESFCGGNGVCPFEFRQHRYMSSIDSFMIDLYRDLFIEPSQKWRIDCSLLDYNLSRLRKCMDLYTKQTNEPAISSLNELTVALEFFLQIDVDTFFLKTCNFRGAQPRTFSKKNGDGDVTEGILCHAKPTADYGMTFCHHKNCFLCESQQNRIGGGGAQRKQSENIDVLNAAGVQFSSNQIHCFVNKYEAILNCDANCTTSNVIYALTCPCGQYDYIDSTSMSFHDRILKHREESNRIIREFLIGMTNIDYMLKQTPRSAQIMSNNNMLLYQHPPRCSSVLQRFLDCNPDYWCLVPMSWQDAKANDATHTIPMSAGAAAAASSISAEANDIYAAASKWQPESPTFAPKPMFFAAVLKNTLRAQEECIWLAKGLPKPPSGYRFSRRQIDEQIDFFKYKKEANIKPSNLIDCYKYTIIAVLPDDCSHELRRFIEALFITHAETKMNTIGHLTHNKGVWPSSTTSFDHSNRGLWFEKLVRRSSST